MLGETLALAHPIIPFVTEELWDNVPGADGLLLVHRYPEPDDALRDEAAEADVRRAITATQELRGWRDRVGAAAGKAVPARLEAEGYDSTAEHIARLARVEWSADGGEPVATVGVPGGSILVLASEAVDVEAAAKRAEAQRATLEKEIARAEGKLANQGFVAKAPPEVVEKERAQARGAQAGAGRPVSTWRLEDAEAHLLSLELFGMRFGLERMRRLLTVLGSPQERFRAIHVVGTNGKSSTARMTAALLEAHGVRTGTFLSPHLTTFAERIRIGDADLGAEVFGAAVQRAAAAAAKVDRTLEEDDRVTQFELLAATAFAEFARQGVEVAVVEAGLGGRHDATNVLGAPVVVLTNVGLEHTRWLGPTVPDIAREKLAVVRRGATLVTGPLDAEVRELAAKTGATVVPAPPVEAGPAGYQHGNFAVAVAAARALHGELDPARVAEVAARVTVPGRMQVMAEEPLTIYDGAHNPSGMQALSTRSTWTSSSPWCRSSTTRTPRACCGRCSGRRREPCSRAPATRARCRPRRSPRWPSSSAARASEIVPDPHAAVARAQELAGPDGRRPGHRLDLPRGRPAGRAGAPEGVRAVNDRGPSLFAMVAVVAVVVALVILVFFAIGFGLGRAFL